MTPAATADLAGLDLGNLDLWKERASARGLRAAPPRAAPLQPARRLRARAGLLVGRHLRRHRQGRSRPRDLLLGPQHPARRQALLGPRGAGPDGRRREHDDHDGPAPPRPDEGPRPACLHPEAGARAHRADARDHQPRLRPGAREEPRRPRRPRPGHRPVRAGDGDRRHARSAPRRRRAAGRLDQPHDRLRGSAPRRRPRRRLGRPAGVHPLRERDDRGAPRAARPTISPRPSSRPRSRARSSPTRRS